MALDAMGEIRQAFLEASRAIPSCEQSESLWYTMLRASELGGGAYPVTIGSATLGDYDDALRTATHRFSKSVRLATLSARKTGTEAAARQAIALDPTYTPARVALAAAQLARNEPSMAVTTLRSIKDLERIEGSNALLGRALLQTGDIDGAIEAAKREQKSDMLDPLEPGTNPRAQSESQPQEVIGDAYLASGRYTAAARVLLVAAAGGSESARSTLAKESRLRAPLSQLAKSGNLPERQRDLAQELIR